MITVGVEQKSGAVTRRLTVSAPSIHRAVELASRSADEARVLFPIDGERFFAPVSCEGIRHGGRPQGGFNREGSPRCEALGTTKHASFGPGVPGNFSFFRRADCAGVRKARPPAASGACCMG